MAGPVLLHQAADADFAVARAEVAADVDGGQVPGDLAEQDGAMDGHSMSDRVSVSGSAASGFAVRNHHIHP
jgi:hypothetical protein